MCTSSQNSSWKIKAKCSDKLNEVARHFNIKMFPTLEALGKELPDSKIAFIDVYDTLNDMIENPKNYGKYEYTSLFLTKNVT